MGYLINSPEVMYLRGVRQKRYAKIQPQFNNKYGDYYPDHNLWFSLYDDASNGMYINSFLGEVTTNMSIALPGPEVFHVQSAGLGYNVDYTSDQPYSNLGPLAEETISCGVSLRFTYQDGILSRDKPWVKYGITWECYGNLSYQESTFLGYLGPYGTPTWSEYQTVASTPYYWFHRIEPQLSSGFGPFYESDSVLIPAASHPEPPEPGEEWETGIKRTRYLGSISVGNIAIYRRGDYHHA